LNNIVAVVPVRVGSTRVPDKGIRPFCGTTLLENKINTLKAVSNIDDIVVSSDGDNILEIAKSLGVSVHKRSEYYASSRCSGSEFFENLAKEIESDVIVYSPPTSPFVTAKTVELAVEKYKEIKNDSVATVHPVKHHMWMHGRPLNYDIENSPNSQDLPEIFRITYGVCVNSNKNMLKCKNVVGINPYFIELDEKQSVDIDNMIDFRFAEFLYEREM
jgi:CMP-N,N'-diacetyllegionaminic acid synthase